MVWLHNGGWEIYSSETALGAKQKMKLFLEDNKQIIDGICVDSGQGTPESLSKCMRKLNLLSPYFNVDSCGLHDIQSVLGYPIQLCMGTRGLDTDDEI